MNFAIESDAPEDREADVGRDACSRDAPGPGLCRDAPEGLMHHDPSSSRSVARAEPEELPGQEIDGILPALRRQPVVLVRQIDQGGGGLFEDEPDAGEQDRYEQRQRADRVSRNDPLPDHASGLPEAPKCDATRSGQEG